MGAAALSARLGPLRRRLVAVMLLNTTSSIYLSICAGDAWPPGGLTHTHWAHEHDAHLYSRSGARGYAPACPDGAPCLPACLRSTWARAVKQQCTVLARARRRRRRRVDVATHVCLAWLASHGMADPLPGPDELCPVGMPADWRARCLGGQLAYSPTLTGGLLPEVGNGHVASVVQSDNVFVAGLFNGDALAKHAGSPYRARVPAVKTEVMHASPSGGVRAMDFERAVFIQRRNVSVGAGDGVGALASRSDGSRRTTNRASTAKSSAMRAIALVYAESLTG
eukprot:4431321-Prymnesium_polylepis.1